MKAYVLGTKIECRELSGADRKAWDQFIYYEVLRTFYSDLHSRVESLPMPLQVAVFAKESPPKQVDPSSPDYYRVASTPAAVIYLLGLVAIEHRVMVTEENAPTILLALREVIFPPRQEPSVDQQAGKDTFAKLEETNGQ